jgi:hypothetical protein
MPALGTVENWVIKITGFLLHDERIFSTFAAPQYRNA